MRPDEDSTRYGDGSGTALLIHVSMPTWNNGRCGTAEVGCDALAWSVCAAKIRVDDQLMIGVIERA
jgi:hypothetical protein